MFHELQIHERTFRVFEEGKGTPILFVHGFPLDHSMWKHQLELFSSAYRVIAPDLRGFGGSSMGDVDSVSMESFAEDLSEILEALSVSEPAIFCGLSMGGYIGWQFLHRFKSRIRAMVLCDTKSAADSTEVARARQMMAQQVLSNGVDDSVRTMVAKLFCQQSLEQQPDMVTTTLNIMLETDRHAIAAAQRGMSERPDMTDFLFTIDVPSLVVCGAEDTITPPEEMRMMANQIPDSAFFLVPEAGHLAPLENPVAFNSILEQYLLQL